MTRLREVLGAPEVASVVKPLTGAAADRPVVAVTLVQDIAALDKAGEDSIALVGAELSKAAASYQFDVALRLARVRGVCALILSGDGDERLSATSTAIADRAAIGVLRAAPGTDLAYLAVAIARAIAGEADVALLRAHTAMRAVTALPPDAQPERIIEAAARELDVAIQRGERPGDGLTAAIRSEGDAIEWLCAPLIEGSDRLARELVLQLTADAVTRSLALARRAEELPIQSRAEVLTHILEAPAHGTAPLIGRARDLDLPVDGWHVAVRIERDDVAEDGDAAYEARQGMARLALGTLRSGAGGVWHSARSGPALVLVRMWREDPGSTAVNDVVAAADRALDAVRRRFGGICRCGVGSVHAGPMGLVSSAAEARAAIVASRPSQRLNAAVAFDGTGLRRSLVEWYTSETAHDAVQAVLAPLTRLGDEKARTAIETLQAYLDHQGSLTRAAEALHLHRNAVAYRVKKIFALLDVDPDNPDDRLLLQLACRAQGLT